MNTFGSEYAPQPPVSKMDPEEQEPIALDEGLGMRESPDLMLEHPPSKSVFGMMKSEDSPPKRGPKTLKKQSCAPKRFRSSFIFFAMHKHKELKEELARQGEKAKTTNITKMVSEAWRKMGPEEKETYKDMAKEDKARYDTEQANYIDERGNPISTKKKQRDPNAPKRPMSAFLAFANSRRAEVKAQNPDCSNGGISKLLSKKWKETPDEITQKYRHEEAALWAAYKAGMVQYRKDNDGRKTKMGGAFVGEAAGGRKKKRKQAKIIDDEPAFAVFDDAPFGGFPPSGMDHVNPHQDDIMAASAALRGVRSGPGTFPMGGGCAAPAMGAGNTPGVAFDGGMQQPQYQQGGGGYNSLFSMNSMSGMNPYGGQVPNPTGTNPGNGGAYGGQEMSNAPNRSFFEMVHPYQQYGGYAGGLGNPQAMLMAQAALRGNPPLYSNGINEQQPPLSQLASLAGAPNGQGHHLGSQQAPPPLSMHPMSGGGMINMMNDDNTNSRLGGDVMLNNGF